VPAATEPGGADRPLVARLCIVSGRVQGVFFRASTANRARELGVTGHARNLDDGRVEVLAVGPEHAVRALCDWLAVGPPAARVARVDTTRVDLPEPPPRSFATA
jgi:acylphosphatase